MKSKSWARTKFRMLFTSRDSNRYLRMNTTTWISLMITNWHPQSTRKWSKPWLFHTLLATVRGGKEWTTHAQTPSIGLQCSPNPMILTSHEWNRSTRTSCSAMSSMNMRSRSTKISREPSQSAPNSRIMKASNSLRESCLPFLDTIQH